MWFDWRGVTQIGYWVHVKAIKGRQLIFLTPKDKVQILNKALSPMASRNVCGQVTETGVASSKRQFG